MMDTLFLTAALAYAEAGIAVFPCVPNGKRPATIMHQHALGYTDEQLALIAGYFAGVAPGRAVAAPAVR